MAGRPPQVFSYPNNLNPPVEQRVAGVEQRFVAPDAQLQRLNLDGSTQWPWRPAYGAVGRPIELWTNHFQIDPTPGMRIGRYTVQITPEPSAAKARRLIQKFLNIDDMAEYKNKVAVDFRRSLVSVVPLPEKVTKKREIIHTMVEEDEPAAGSSVHPKQRFEIKLIEPVPYSYDDLLQSLRNPAPARRVNRAEIVACLNIILNHTPKSRSLGLRPALAAGSGNRFFDYNGQRIKDLGGGLLAVEGFETSVRAVAGRILLNAQIRYGVLLKDGALIQVYGEFVRDRPEHDARAGTRFLKHKRVILTHLPKKLNSAGNEIPMVKTCAGIAKRFQDQHCMCPRDGATPSEVKFKHRDRATGKEKTRTVQFHFKTEYGISTSDQYPVVNLGTEKQPLYFPMEVLHLLPGQPTRMALAPQQTANLTNRFAIRPAADNATSVARTSQRMLGIQSPNAHLQAMGITLGNQLLRVPARVLDAPVIEYGGKPNQPQFGAWNLKQARFTKPVSSFNWGVLRIKAKARKDNAIYEPATWNGCLKAFKEQMGLVGMGAKDPLQTWDFNAIQQLDINDQSLQQLENLLRSMMTSKLYTSPSSIMLVVAPDNVRLHKFLKTVFDTKLGMRMIKVKSDRFIKSNAQLYANILMKFNLQLGGVNQVLKSGGNGLYAHRDTLTLGWDVTHPSPDSRDDAPSTATYVANPTCDGAQFPCMYRTQRKFSPVDPTKKAAPALEPAGALDEAVTWFLKGFAASHAGKLPKYIVGYRDGVSEGQYSMVRDHEVTAIKRGFAQAAKDLKIEGASVRVAVAITGKRHSIRFYPTSAQNGHIDTRSQSAPAGTVVDRHVTSPDAFDYYLQAHAAIQGTSKFAHYYLVFDEIFGPLWKTLPKLPNANNAADYFQIMTNNVCYAYQRATRSVSLAPPAYYADLAADRARLWLSEYYDPTSAERGSDNGAANAAEGNFPTIAIHTKLQKVMTYI